MRLSWNEVRVPAPPLSPGSGGDAAYEKGETQSFYNDFFAVFGVQRRSVARYEEHVKKLDDRSGFIDLFWPGVLIVEQKSAGRDLEQGIRPGRGVFRRAAGARPSPLHSGQRFSDVRTARSRRARSCRLSPRGPARQRREIRLHPRRAAPDLPRPGPRQYRRGRTGRTAARCARRGGLPRPRSGTISGADRVLPVRGRHRHLRTARHLPRPDRGTHKRRRIGHRLRSGRVVSGAGYTRGRTPENARRRSCPLPPMSTAPSSTGRCASRPSTRPCAGRCSTPAASTGRTSRRPSSARCSSRSWTRRSAGRRARITRPRRTS